MAGEDNLIHIDWSQFNTDTTNLKKVLEDLEDKVYRKMAKGTCLEATKPMLESVKNNCPQDTGALRNSLMLAVSHSNVKGFTSAGVWPDKNYELLDNRGVTRKPKYYLHLVEFGTKNTQPSMFLQKSFARTWQWSLAIVNQKFDEIIRSLPEVP